MNRYRVIVRASFIGYVQAKSFSQACDMAKQKYGRIQAIERV